MSVKRYESLGYFLRAICKTFVILTFFIVAVGAFAQPNQNIVTASSYFKGVCDVYSKIKDYQVTMDITVTQGKEKTFMSTTTSFKSPNLLRLDFSRPKEQVICFNGNKLIVYLPKTHAILEQAVTSDDSDGARLATSSGLSMMSRYYTVAYEIGQSPVPLEKNSTEDVIKLILTRKSNLESFRTIALSITPKTNLIRRLKATASNGNVFIFDYYDYMLNQNMSEQRFLYDPPSSANNFSNFLFGGG